MRILFFLLFPIFVSAQINRAYGVIEIGSFPTSSSTGPKFAYRPADSSFYRWVSGSTWLKIIPDGSSGGSDTLYLKQISGTTALADGDTIDISTYLLKSDTASMLTPYIRLAGYGLSKLTTRTLSVDTSVISTKIYSNRFLLKSDTASMLQRYIERGDTLAMLAVYVRSAGYGLTKSSYTLRVDTSLISTKAYVRTNPTLIGSGQIAYSNGTNSVGSPNNFWDNTNVRLGIGTNSPSYTIDVNSTGAVRIPRGTTAQRPTTANGWIRFNTDLDAFEGGRNSNATVDQFGMLGKTQTWTATNTFKAPGTATETSILSTNTSALELFRLSGNGNVHLGLTNSGAGNVWMQWGKKLVWYNVNYSPSFTFASQGRGTIEMQDGFMAVYDNIRVANPSTAQKGVRMSFAAGGGTFPQVPAYVTPLAGENNLYNVDYVSVLKHLYVGVLGNAGNPPTDGLISSQTSSSTATDIAGSNLILQAGGGTGASAISGNIYFNTPNVLSSGTTQQTYSQRAAITRTGSLLVGTGTEILDVQLNIVSDRKGALVPRLTTTQRNSLSRSILSLTITNPGTGYTGVIPLTFSGGGGSATAQSTVSGGGLLAATVLTNTVGFTSTPTVIVGGSGSGGAVTATLSNPTSSQVIYNTDSLFHETYINGWKGVAYRDWVRSYVSSTAQNFASTNLTATGNRTHNWANYNFTWTNMKKFMWGSDSLFKITKEFSGYTYAVMRQPSGQALLDLQGNNSAASNSAELRLTDISTGNIIFINHDNRGFGSNGYRMEHYNGSNYHNMLFVDKTSRLFHINQGGYSAGTLQDGDASIMTGLLKNISRNGVGTFNTDTIMAVHYFRVKNNLTKNRDVFGVYTQDVAIDTMYFRLDKVGRMFQYKPSFFYNTVSMPNYGVGNKEASDLSKTKSNYIAGFATDGTVIDVPINIETYSTITSTSSPQTLSSTIADNLINQGSTQAMFTFKLPASPIDGQISKLTFANAVTALTIDGNGTTVSGTLPTTASISTHIIFKNYAGVGWIRQY